MVDHAVRHTDRGRGQAVEVGIQAAMAHNNHQPGHVGPLNGPQFAPQVLKVGKLGVPEGPDLGAIPHLDAPRRIQRPPQRQVVCTRQGKKKRNDQTDL